MASDLVLHCLPMPHKKDARLSKTCLKRPLKKKNKIGFKTDYCLMQVKSIAGHSAILSTFIKLPFAAETFVLSIFEWPLKTGFTVYGLKGSFQ